MERVPTRTSGKGPDATASARFPSAVCRRSFARSASRALIPTAQPHRQALEGSRGPHSSIDVSSRQNRVNSQCIRLFAAPAALARQFLLVFPRALNNNATGLFRSELFAKFYER